MLKGFSKLTSEDLKKHRYLLIPLLAMASFESVSDEYRFDPSLLQGSSGIDINLLDNDNVSAGTYTLDIFVNGKLILSGEDVTFSLPDSDEKIKKAVPCLNYKTIVKFGLKNIKKESDSAKCYPVTTWNKNISWAYESNLLKLNFNIPMVELINTPRGYVSTSDLDEGDSNLFLSHSTNYTETKTGNSQSYQYFWSGIKSGANIGLWQFRNQANLRYSNQITSSKFNYDPVRTWVQRPIESVGSELKLGDNYTKDSLFGSLSFNGVQLSTDERMLPQSRRGYAPEIRGTASSSARVVISQLGKKIYETTVPPGPFIISDLYNTSTRGDLSVDVIEANGKTSNFTVPYSSVPDSVRPGNYIYSLSAGKVRGYNSLENRFLELILQKGVNNNFTANTGLRYAQDYMAALAGGVWSSKFGALGLNFTFSNAKNNYNTTDNGWRSELTFSKSFESGTNILFAAYHYSTKGFRDLTDVLGERLEYNRGEDYYSDTLHQQNEFSISLSQSLQGMGNVNLTGSTSNYYGSKSRITQLQLGYNNNWGNVNYSVNMSRQRTTSSNYSYDSEDNAYRYNNAIKFTENTISLNITIPLDFNRNTTIVSYNYNKTKETSSSTIGMSGSAGKNKEYTYSIYGGYESNTQSSNQSSFGGSLNNNNSFGSMNASYNQGSSYRQLGLGLSGTAVIHKGGITLGPYASDTFALVYAKGAKGARLQNGLGSTIDSSGYAIYPNLTPYQMNNIYLDASTLDDDAELTGGGVRVAPYAGAVPEVKFTTRRGKAVLITITGDPESLPPMGANVEDYKGNILGMVGQAGQVYARVAQSSGMLRIRWSGKSCDLPYKIDEADSVFIYNTTSTCKR